MAEKPVFFWVVVVVVPFPRHPDSTVAISM